MRLHENKEGDELQRLRARRQGTGRNYKNRPRQTKTVDHTYDEDYYEEEDYDYEYEEEPDPNGLEVPFENDNRRSAGVSHRYSEYSNQSRGKRKTSNRYSTSGTTGNVEASASSGKTGKTGRNNPGKTSRKRKKAKWPVILLSLLVVLCVYGGWSFLRRATGYWNIAVFGVDSRDGNTKNALADVQLICSINQETGEIKLVSVYRDTYLKINSKGTYHKINEAYFKGGHKQAVSALEENLDVKINDYATFNWKAVAQAINVLGGVDLSLIHI